MSKYGQREKSRQSPTIGTCSACRFFVPADDSGYCYRYPPQGLNALQTMRPSTKPDWWCGEWEGRT
jgi:hypothetical protein